MEFSYDLWYDGEIIHAEYLEFESEEDARQDAKDEIELRKSYWDADGVEYDETLFEIDITELD